MMGLRKRNVLITGVSGYIGNLLARFLEGKPGIGTVAGIDIKELPENDGRIVFFRRDVRDPLDGLIRKHRIDTVIHTAYILPPLHDTHLMEDININGTRSVLQSCRNAGVKHILYTSSTTAYGFHPDNDSPLLETSPLRGNGDFTYSRTKREIEHIMRDFIKQNSAVAVTVLRPCFVVGPGFDNPLARHLRKKIVLLPGGRSPMQFVHENDLVKIIYLLLKTGRPGIFNVAAEGTMTFEEMTQALGNSLVSLPAPLMSVLNSIAWFFRLRFLSEFPSPALNMVRYSWVASSGKLKRETGFTYHYSTREAFEDFARYVKKIKG